jgi:hypothetical protein
MFPLGNKVHPWGQTHVIINWPQHAKCLPCHFDAFNPGLALGGRGCPHLVLALVVPSVHDGEAVLTNQCFKTSLDAQHYIDCTHMSPSPTRVARWFVFKPKIQIWVNFGGPCNERCWLILWPFDLFYCHFVYLMVISYILWIFGYIFPILLYIVPGKIWQLCPPPQKAEIKYVKGIT